jgi:hypothetical protein
MEEIFVNFITRGTVLREEPCCLLVHGDVQYAEF